MKDLHSKNGNHPADKGDYNDADNDCHGSTANGGKNLTGNDCAQCAISLNGRPSQQWLIQRAQEMAEVRGKVSASGIYIPP